MFLMKGRKLFYGFIYLVAFLLFFCAFYYTSAYWSNFFQGGMPHSYQIIAYSLQFVFFALAVLIIIFRKRLYIKRKEIILLIVTCIVCLVIVEFASRVYVCGAGRSDLMLYGQCGIKPIYSPHHYLNYHGTPNYVSPDGLNIHNSLGFRGPEISIPKQDSMFR